MIDRLGGIQQTTQTQGVQQVTLDERAAERLRSLNAGDSLQGRVVSVSTDAEGNRTAQVDLGNGAMVNARLSGNMSLQAGENITFTVRQAGGNALTLSPLYTNTAANSTITQALSQAGLAATNTLTEMVRSMMNEGMSIDRMALQQMAGRVAEFPNVGVTTLVHMSNLNVPLNAANIEMFTAYENYEHQVVNGMEQIFDALPDSFNALLQQEDFGTAMDMYGEIMEMITEGGEDGSGNTPSGALGATSPQGGRTDITGFPAGMPDGAAGLNQGLPAGMTDVAAGLNHGLPLEGEMSAKQTEGVSSAAIAAENLLAADKGAATDIQSMQFSKAFTDLLKSVGVSDQTINNLLNAQGGAGKDPFTALLHELSMRYAQTAHTSDAMDKNWTSLFSTKEYNAVLKEAISSQWLLKPEAVADKENVESLYRRLNAQTKALTDIIQNAAGADTKAAQAAQNLAKNVTFMQDMNQMYSFVQLPLKLQGDNAHGDLYVYRNRKKSMAEDDGTTSAVLHLDMDHLGPLDVYIKMKDRDVTTNFFLADDEAMDLIEAHVDELEARIMKRGYKVTISTGLKEDMKSNPAVDEFLQVATENTPVFAGAFDARA